MESNIKPYPSSCQSWLNCSAYCISNQDKPRNTPTINQLEGLVNHQIAEQVLVTDCSLESQLDRQITIKNHKGVVTREMLTRLKGYINYIQQIRKPVSMWGVETPVKISSIDPKYQGRIDYWQYNQLTKTLTVVDYKDGWSHISPVSNYTLTSYAIGLIDNFKKLQVDKFEYVIYQPRLSNEPKTFINTGHDVINSHRDRLKKAYMQAVKGPYVERPGEHCKYCHARSTCVGFNHAVNNLYTAYSYSNDLGRFYDLGKRLEFLEHASMMINASLTAEKEVISEKLKSGKPVEGWVLESGRGRLMFSDDIDSDEVVEICKMFGVDAGTFKLRTPTQLKTLGIPQELLQKYVKQVSGEAKIKKISSEYIKNIFKD